MPNRKYLSGRSFEYKLKADLEADGFSVIRASGSHGHWDILGFKHMRQSDRVLVKCIQCKVTTAKNVEALKREFYRSVPFTVSHNTGQVILEQYLAVKTKGHKNYDLYSLPECK